MIPSILSRTVGVFAVFAASILAPSPIPGSTHTGSALAAAADAKAKTKPVARTQVKSAKPVSSPAVAPAKAAPPVVAPAKVVPAKTNAAPLAPTKPAAVKKASSAAKASPAPAKAAPVTKAASVTKAAPVAKAAPAPATLPIPIAKDEVKTEPAKAMPALPAADRPPPPPILPSAATLAAADIFGPAQSIDATDDSRRVLQVRKGDTLMDILLGVGVSRAEAHDAVSALREVYNPRDLKPGQEITLTLGPGASDRDSSLVGAAFDARADRTVSLVRRDNGRFSALGLDKVLSRDVTLIKGAVRSSLYEAAADQGVPASILAELIGAFSYDVDFQRDLQPGDGFEVLFERFHDEIGRVARDGVLIFGGLTLSGVSHRVYRHVPQGETAEYFNEKGESVRKALLRTPIDGAKLTSSFGNRRHPVLGYSAMHRGVDFGAVEGTPIQAAGTGTIEQVGPNGNYGKYIRIRHNPEFATAYAHLSRFAGDLRIGGRIKQGEIIGYVGSTGLSTGPHLHYEVIRRGAQVNPLSVKFPTGYALRGADLQKFVQARTEIDVKAAGLASELRVVDDSRAAPDKPHPAKAVDPKPAAKRKVPG